MVPQVMQSGESTAVPVICSRSSALVWACWVGLGGTARCSERLPECRAGYGRAPGVLVRRAEHQP